MEFRVIKTHSAVQGAPDQVDSNSSAISIGRARGISLQFIGENMTSGSATVSVDVSNDGYNFADYNLMVSNVTGTAGESLIYVGSNSMSSTGNAVFLLSPVPPFEYLRTSLSYSTDGSFTVLLGISQDQ